MILFQMDWNQFVYELYKAYHLDSIYSSITNVSFGVPSRIVIIVSCVRNEPFGFVRLELMTTKILLYPIAKAIYNIYFHPLSKYPGPILAKATKIPVALVQWEGNLSQWTSDLHTHFRSDVVRIAPDELSFIASSAWKDIYGVRPGQANFPKDRNVFFEVNSMITANDADHSRYRRLLSHGKWPSHTEDTSLWVYHKIRKAASHVCAKA